MLPPPIMFRMLIDFLGMRKDYSDALMNLSIDIREFPGDLAQLCFPSLFGRGLTVWVCGI